MSDTRLESDFGARRGGRAAAARSPNTTAYAGGARPLARQERRLLPRHRAAGALRRAVGRERARDRLRHRRPARRAQAQGGVGVDISPRLVERSAPQASRTSSSSSPTPSGSTRPSSSAGPSTTSSLSDVVGSIYDVWRALRALRRVCTSAHAHHRHLLQLRVGAGAQAGRALRPEDAHRAAELARHGRSAEPARAQPLRDHPLGHRAAVADRRAVLWRRSPIATSRSCPGCAISRSRNTSSASWPAAAGRMPDARLLVQRHRPVQERARQHRRHRRPHARHGQRHRAHLRRRQLERRHRRRRSRSTSQAGTRTNMRLIHQGDGKGKGDAVRKGFAAATGDMLFILDADLTVPPEDLPKFYAALAEGKAEFVNGSRLVYPMEGEAMRFLNSLGNKFFGLALSAILEQRLKDTLCGTKVLFRRDYERIAADARLLRRLRSVRRLRSAVRRRQAEPQDRRAADPLSRAHLRRDQDQPLQGRRNPRPHDAARLPQVQGGNIDRDGKDAAHTSAAPAGRARAQQRGRSPALLLSGRWSAKCSRRGSIPGCAFSIGHYPSPARDRLRLGPAHADAGLDLRRALRRSTSSASRAGCASGSRCLGVHAGRARCKPTRRRCPFPTATSTASSRSPSSSI